MIGWTSIEEVGCTGNHPVLGRASMHDVRLMAPIHLADCSKRKLVIRNTTQSTRAYIASNPFSIQLCGKRRAAGWTQDPHTTIYSNHIQTLLAGLVHSIIDGCVVRCRLIRRWSFYISTTLLMMWEKPWRDDLPKQLTGTFRRTNPLLLTNISKADDSTSAVLN